MNDALHVETGSEGPVTGVGDFSRDYVARETDDVYVYDEMYALHISVHRDTTPRPFYYTSVPNTARTDTDCMITSGS